MLSPQNDTQPDASEGNLSAAACRLSSVCMDGLHTSSLSPSMEKLSVKAEIR